MTLVKYIDLVFGQLINNQETFILQLEKQLKYKDLKYQSLYTIVKIIVECIYGEAHRIDFELADENVKSLEAGEDILFNEKERAIEETKRIISRLHEMESLINDPATPIDLQDLESRSIFYESFLALFKHNQSIISTIDFAEEYSLPAEVVADDGIKLAAIAKEIFANIKQATSRSLIPQSMQDISKEEWVNSVSGSKYAKARALEKIKTVQQLESSRFESQRLKTSAKSVFFSLDSNNQDSLDQPAKAKKLHFSKNKALKVVKLSKHK